MYNKGADLSIVSTSGQAVAVRGVGEAGHLVEVTLLLEGLLLTLPLPHQELAQVCTAQRHQVARRVERYWCDGPSSHALFGDSERRGMIHEWYIISLFCLCLLPFFVFFCKKDETTKLCVLPCWCFGLNCYWPSAHRVEAHKLPMPTCAHLCPCWMLMKTDDITIFHKDW